MVVGKKTGDFFFPIGYRYCNASASQCVKTEEKTIHRLFLFLFFECSNSKSVLFFIWNTQKKILFFLLHQIRIYFLVVINSLDCYIISLLRWGTSSLWADFILYRPGPHSPISLSFALPALSKYSISSSSTSLCLFMPLLCSVPAVFSPKPHPFIWRMHHFRTIAPQLSVCCPCTAPVLHIFPSTSHRITDQWGALSEHDVWVGGELPHPGQWKESGRGSVLSALLMYSNRCSVHCWRGRATSRL